MTLSELVASGRIVDLIIAVVTIEAFVLGSRRMITARGIAVLDLLSGLAPGIGLLLAIRAALTSASWEVVAAWLTCAGALHVWDIVCRHRSLANRGSVGADSRLPSRV